MAIRTPVCDLLGVEAPIVGAGMGGVSDPRLAAAVSEAGGLGTLALVILGAMPPEQAAAAVRETRSLTQRPFSVNFILPQTAQQQELAGAELHAVLEAGPPSVTLSFGDPSPYLPVVREAGALAIVQVQTVAAAVEAVRAGADVVIAQGSEAGGHTGQMPLFALLPQVVAAVGDTPVLAAGAVTGGHALAAALALGAQGVVLGTALIVAEEARSAWGDRHVEAILRAGADDTLWSYAIDVAAARGPSTWPAGVGARSVRTPFVERWAGHEDELLERVEDAVAGREDSDGGERDATPLYAGAAAGLVTERRPVAAIIRSVLEEAERVIHRLPDTAGMTSDTRR